MAVVCPECDNPLIIDADEVEEGETVQCDECGIDLEVVSVDPLELAAVDDAGYDDEDDDYDDCEDGFHSGASEELEEKIGELKAKGERWSVVAEVRHVVGRDRWIRSG